MRDVEVTRGRVMNGLVWSLVQSWSNRILTFLLFLILARLLTPADLGLASMVALILLVFGYCAEFGYGQALIQSSRISPNDASLPFATCVVLSLALAGAMVVFSPKLETWLGVPGLAPLLPLSALTLPLATLSSFQEAFYKRAFEYRILALRMLVATVISGVVGVLAALYGLGAAALVLQALTLNLVSALWLWSRPIWVPRQPLNWAAWRTLTGFSVHVVGSRLLEFATTRIIDVLVLALYGVVGLGIFTVGSRVYQTLLQVLMTALSDVSLSALSRMNNDKERMKAAYLKSIGISAYVCSPIFIAVAALSPELTLVLFGDKWAGSAPVMSLLMVLGAVQTIQFINGAYFTAVGKPSYVLALNIVKLAILVPAMLLIPSDGIEELTLIFVLGQLAITPLTFALIIRLLRIRWVDIVLQCRSVILAVVAASVTISTRDHLPADLTEVFFRLPILAAVFGSAYLALVALFARSQTRTVLELLLGGLRRKGLPLTKTTQPGT